MLAPSALDALAAAAQVELTGALWGVDLDTDARAWSVEDGAGAWLLVWAPVAEARELRAAPPPTAWQGCSWRRSRLAALDNLDELPDEDRDRLTAAST